MSIQQIQSQGIFHGLPVFPEHLKGLTAIATGANGLFIETHPNPAVAKSDGANMLKLDLLEGLLQQLVELRKTIAKFKI